MKSRPALRWWEVDQKIRLGHRSHVGSARTDQLALTERRTVRAVLAALLRWAADRIDTRR